MCVRKRVDWVVKADKTFVVRYTDIFQVYNQHVIVLIHETWRRMTYFYNFSHYDKLNLCIRNLELLILGE